MSEEILLDPTSQAFIDLARAIAEASHRGAQLLLTVEPARSDPVFDPGDQVTVPFDNGPGPAEVISAEDGFVRVKYGPGGKYTTSLSWTSVATRHRVETPAKLTVSLEGGS